MDEYGMPYTRIGKFSEYVFTVQRNADGLAWEFDHEPMWEDSGADDEQSVAVEGLQQVVATLRRWADELDAEQVKMTAKLEVNAQ